MFKKAFGSKKSVKNDKLENDAAGLPPRINQDVKSQVNSTNNSSFEPLTHNNQQVSVRDPGQLLQQPVPTIYSPGMSQIQINNGTGFQLGNTYYITSTGTNSSGQEPNRMVPKNPKIQKTTTILEMMNSNLPIPDKLLDVIAGNLGLRWKELMLVLGIHHLESERVYIDNRDEGIKEVIYTLLEQHFQNNPESKTIGYITKMLWNNGFKETVDIVKKKYKDLKKCDDSEML